MTSKERKKGFFGKFLSGKDKGPEQPKEVRYEINENTDVTKLPWDIREGLFRERLAEAYGLSEDDVSGFFVSRTYANSFAKKELALSESDPTTLMKYASIIIGVGQIEKSSGSNEAWIRETISRALKSKHSYFPHEVLKTISENPAKYIELSKQFFVTSENLKGELEYAG